MDPLEWQLPGGRVAFGESPIEALRREVAEETGLAVEVVAPVATWHYVKGRCQLVGIDFLCDPTSARAERPGYSTGEDSQTPVSGNTKPGNTSSPVRADGRTRRSTPLGR